MPNRALKGIEGFEVLRFGLALNIRVKDSIFCRFITIGNSDPARRRHVAGGSDPLMEKVNVKSMQVKSMQSRLCLLASLAALLWFCLLYFHFVGLGVDNSVDASAQLDPISFSNGVIAAAADDDNDSKNDGDRILNSTSSKDGIPDSTTSKDGVFYRIFDNITSKDGILDQVEADNATSVMKNEGKKTEEGPKNYPFMKVLRAADDESDPCGGRYVYVHDLPPRFNEDMVKQCKSLSIWTDMCKFTDYAGLGPPLDNTEGVFSNTGWYSTNQFAVDVIFSNRMKQYECLTNDSSLAAAIFVPFYAGFDVARYLWGYNTSTRDSASLDLISWLMGRPEWKIMNGKDHFLVAGRITWDFRRRTDRDSDWGNKLLFLPAARNMSMLVVEASPWNSNDFGIPYPTYFHPSKDEEVFLWQERIRKLDTNQKHLFCFAGAPRPGKADSIRGQIIGQCKNSSHCRLLECGLGESKCRSPSSIMQMFQSSVFCLQPQGDSYTRRSAFDSMLAGCIPVFFHPASFYTQYVWHLPRDYRQYSVFIPEDDVRTGNVNLEERLSQIPEDKVREMRETVISLIPRLIYADPRSKLETLKDAFDMAVQAVINKVTRLRKDVVNGRKRDDFDEVLSWKYDLSEDGEWIGPHEFDPYLRNKDGGSNTESPSAEAGKNSWKSEHGKQ